MAFHDLFGNTLIRLSKQNGGKAQWDLDLKFNLIQCNVLSPQQCWIISKCPQLSQEISPEEERGRGLPILGTCGRSFICPYVFTISPRRRPENAEKRSVIPVTRRILPQGAERPPPIGLCIVSIESVWENNLRAHLCKTENTPLFAGVQRVALQVKAAEK